MPRPKGKKSLALRRARMRLIEAGLRGDEADELLDQLKSEFERGAPGDEQEYRRFLRQQVKELKVNPTPARGEKWQNRLETVLLALFSSGLYDLLKGAFESPPRAPSSECERHLPIQWIRAESASAWSGNEYLFRRVVGIKRTAQSLTSLAMCLDAQGHYAEAERCCAVSAEASITDDIVSQAIWRGARARVLARGDDAGSAIDLATAAVSLAAETDFLMLHADALCDRADALAATKQHEAAIADLEGAVTLYERKGMEPAAGRARAVRESLLSASIGSGRPSAARRRV